MPLTQDSVIPGTHMFLFPAGRAFTIPGAGTCARESKPGATDPLWLDLGAVEDSDIDRSSEEIKIFKPSPGRLRLWKKKEFKDEMTIKCTSKEISAYVVQVLLKTLSLTSASTQFNPLEGVEMEAWLKLQSYNDADALWLTMDTYVHVKLTGGIKLGGGLIEPSFEFSVLHSTLNTGTL